MCQDLYSVSSLQVSQRNLKDKAKGKERSSFSDVRGKSLPTREGGAKEEGRRCSPGNVLGGLWRVVYVPTTNQPVPSRDWDTAALKPVQQAENCKTNTLYLMSCNHYRLSVGDWQGQITGRKKVFVAAARGSTSNPRLSGFWKSEKCVLLF